MILHIDMDAFYASVEMRERPELANRPVIVGGTPEGRGVVAAANYQARAFGVHSAMPAVVAKRLCPQAVVLRPRMELYAKVAEQIREIFHRYTPAVEPLSLDEAFLDATGSEALYGPTVKIGRLIKQDIQDQLQLVASVGVAPNKFLAKIASDLDKPNGFVVVDPDRVYEFLDPLPIGRLWGVGRVTEETLRQSGIQTIGQVREMSEADLQAKIGQQGQHLWQLSQGIDDRPVVSERIAKSVSHETTFPVDIVDIEVLRAWALDLAEQVAWRLRRHQLRGRTVQLKVRFSDFETITRAVTLPTPTDVTQEIWQAANDLFTHRLPAGHRPVRLLGVGVSGFDQGRAEQQQWLFDQPDRNAQSDLDRTTDQIRAKFGSTALGRAGRLLHAAGEPNPPGASAHDDKVKDTDNPNGPRSQ
jgi:DNA polymerase-4